MFAAIFIQPIFLSAHPLVSLIIYLSNHTSVQHISVTDWGATNCRSKFSTQHRANYFYFESQQRADEHFAFSTAADELQQTYSGQMGWYIEIRMETSPFMVVVYEGRHGADLDGVRVIGWVFKQAVVWVEQLSGHQEEKLSGGSTVVQPAVITHQNTQIRTHVSGKSESVTLLCDHAKQQCVL